MPFIISGIGVAMDASTSIIGLSTGYVETHSYYSPVWAILIFWSVIVATFLLPRTKITRVFTIMISFTPFIGVVNNTLLMAGITRSAII